MIKYIVYQSKMNGLELQGKELNLIFIYNKEFSVLMY